MNTISDKIREVAEALGLVATARYERGPEDRYAFWIHGDDGSIFFSKPLPTEVVLFSAWVQGEMEKKGFFLDYISKEGDPLDRAVAIIKRAHELLLPNRKEQVMRDKTSFHQYIQLAKVTESYERTGRWQGAVPTRIFRLLHALIGLSTEASELLSGVFDKDNENMAEEIGDCWWYAAIMADELDMDILTLNHQLPDMSPEDLVHDMQRFIGDAFDVLKRRIYYNADGTDPKSSWATFQPFARSILEFLCIITKTAGFELSVVWDANIAKLRKRYGTKFNQHDALVRDLAAEARALKEGLEASEGE